MRGQALTRVVVALGLAGCFAGAGAGTDPPPNRFNYPVGLAVSPKGDVLYAANSNFDLQWNGGTLQSYDLAQVRSDVRALIDDPAAFKAQRGSLLVDPAGLDRCAATQAPQGNTGTLGLECAPAVRSEAYFKSSVVVGAFATDLVLAPDGSRLFSPVRGDASLTWVDVNGVQMSCGQGGDGRCDAAHRAGNNPDEPDNSRHVTMPGEPFGIALSEDGRYAVVTHQTDTKSSLLSTGLTAPGGAAISKVPSLQFVLDGVNGGGIGLAAVPHPQEAFAPCVDVDLTNVPAAGSPARAAYDACIAAMPRPAFLQTSRNVAKVDLLRVYSDEGYNGNPSAPHRPFLQREAEFDVLANAGNFDSRGLAIDSTPRMACRQHVLDAKLPAGAERTAQLVQCARIPARVFIANRSPASVLVGELGQASADGATYDPDHLSIRTSIPLTAGPSRVYLAPVVEADGSLGLRVFVVCFDASTIFVVDPNAGVVENIVRVGDGPFAMAFDPFKMEDVAAHAKAPADYRFAYVAIFRNSHLQILDLDNSQQAKQRRYTYENVVYTLGEPTAPKGGL